MESIPTVNITNCHGLTQNMKAPTLLNVTWLNSSSTSTSYSSEMLPTHWLISIKDLNMSCITRMCNIPYVKENKGKNPRSVPSSGSQLKVNGVFFGLRPILHPMFIEIWLVVFVWSCSQTKITTNGQGWKHNPIFFYVEHLLLLLILQWHYTT